MVSYMRLYRTPRVAADCHCVPRVECMSDGVRWIQNDSELALRIISALSVDVFAFVHDISSRVVEVVIAILLALITPSPC